MSVEDGKELRDLVVQTLEKKGVLGKVQAEIRASVFLALEEQDIFKDKSPFLNKPLKDYVNTSDGAIIISLVREFLEFFNLEFTTMVFDPETHAGIDYKYEGRLKLAEDLVLKSSDEGKNLPLLSILLKSMKRPEVPSVTEFASCLPESNEETPRESKSPIKESCKPPNLNRGANGDVHDIHDLKNNQLHEILSKMDLNNVQSGGFGQGDNITDNFLSKLIMSDKPATQKTEPGAKTAISNSTSLSSLGELPPLGSKRKSDPASSSDNPQRITNDLKDILDLGLGEPKYEDDFMSSTSEKIQKDNKCSSESDESEIEEEISTPSNNSLHADDATIDVSVSKTSIECDYLEDV